MLDEQKNNRFDNYLNRTNMKQQITFETIACVEMKQNSDETHVYI